MFRILITYLQVETVRTMPKSRCNIFTANLILSTIEFTIWTSVFIFGLGRYIISEDHWQIYENNYLSIVAFFVIFGFFALEIFGISGTTKRNWFAMMFVFCYQFSKYCFILNYYDLLIFYSPRLLIFFYMMWNFLRTQIQLAIAPIPSIFLYWTWIIIRYNIL